MFKNRHGLFIIIAVFSLGMVSAAQAGMINYERRKGVVTKAPAKKPAPAAVPAQPPASSAYTNNSAVNSAAIPGGLSKAMSDTEKKFDANKDGILQADEKKKFLREVLAAAQSKGGYTVNSDFLKKYDANGDGVITRYEVSSLQADTK